MGHPGRTWLFPHKTESSTGLPCESGINILDEYCTIFYAILTNFNHIQKVSRRINSFIFIIRRLSNFPSTKVLLTAYYGCMYPHISYGVAIWGAETSKTKAIFVLQKKVMRLIFGIQKGDSCRGIFAGNNLLTFSCLYTYESLSLLLKK